MAQESVRVASSTSILMIIGVIVFVVSLGGVAATFLIKDYLNKQQASLSVALTQNENRLNPTLIEDLKKANTKIDLANELLKNHVAVSEAFKIIAALTAEKISFSSFEFSSSNTSPEGTPTENTTYRIKMKGIADSFNSVAWQAKVFSESKKYGTNKVLKNPVLSDLVVDQGGDVSFLFSADIALDDISYVKSSSLPTN